MAQFIHYEPDRIDFTLSALELDSIVRISSNSWKDFAIALFGVGIPCAINAWIAMEAQNPLKITVPIFLNTVVGALGLVLGVVFVIVWWRTRVRASEILAQIKNKPKWELPAITSSVGGATFATTP